MAEIFSKKETKLDINKLNEIIDDWLFLCFETKNFPKSEWIYTTSDKLEQILDAIKSQCQKTEKNFIQNNFDSKISTVNILISKLESLGECFDTSSVIVTVGCEKASDYFAGKNRSGFRHDWDQGTHDPAMKDKPCLFINIVCKDKTTTEQLRYLGQSQFSSIERI